MQKILSHFWTILWNLASVAVVLAMFHIAQSRFETMVVSGLVIIYASLEGAWAILSRTLSERWHEDLWRYIQLAKSHSLETDSYEMQYSESSIALERSKDYFSIISFFTGLISLIAIGNLVYLVT